ncbi:methyl-accepting chemotaxis protein [Brevibacillus humidisoli]|uniref:HAMP domain-containing protein n=1 Tax=Brevibacillus humidisoli TaxID=2895522 RepID=UPI001E55C997|nr:methyl-accepting chemotaxis protein [Brevibacillus humidisoli]UFJ39354.1 methyl-accepting chemotaxis protein [Brevibacillus humidisoli]
MKAVESDDFDKARQLMFGEEYASYKQKINEMILQFQETMEKRVDGEKKQASDMAAFYLMLTNVMIALVLLRGAGVFVVLFKKLRPLTVVSQRLNELAGNEGDLTARLPVTGKDEVGELSASFNAMLEQIQRLVAQVGESAEQVVASAEELSAGVEQNSKAAEQISLTIQEVAAGTDRQVQSVGEGSASIAAMTNQI